MKSIRFALSTLRLATVAYVVFIFFTWFMIPDIYTRNAQSTVEKIWVPQNVSGTMPDREHLSDRVTVLNVSPEDFKVAVKDREASLMFNRADRTVRMFAMTSDNFAIVTDVHLRPRDLPEGTMVKDVSFNSNGLVRYDLEPAPLDGAALIVMIFVLAIAIGLTWILSLLAQVLLAVIVGCLCALFPRRYQERLNVFSGAFFPGSAI